VATQAHGRVGNPRHGRSTTMHTLEGIFILYLLSYPQIIFRRAFLFLWSYPQGGTARPFWRVRPPPLWITHFLIIQGTYPFLVLAGVFFYPPNPVFHAPAALCGRPAGALSVAISRRCLRRNLNFLPDPCEAFTKIRSTKWEMIQEN